MDMEALDSNLVSAMVKSLETGSLTPMIKEELRLKIQTTRLAAGKEELPGVVFKEPEKHELTAEEEKRREVRRERNRVAALKCRSKKKSALERAQKEVKEQMMRRQRLTSALKELESEKLKLLRELREKDIAIPLSLTVSSEVALQTKVKNEDRTGNSTVTSETHSEDNQTLSLPPGISPALPLPPTSPFQFQMSPPPYGHFSMDSLYSTSVTPPPMIFNAYDPPTPSTSSDVDPVFTSWSQFLSSTPHDNLHRRTSSTSTVTHDSAETSEQQILSPDDIMASLAFQPKDFHTERCVDSNTRSDHLAGDKYDVDTVPVTNALGLTSEFMGIDEAQVPGYLMVDDEVISSQELLTLYD